MVALKKGAIEGCAWTVDVWSIETVIDISRHSPAVGNGGGPLFWSVTKLFDTAFLHSTHVPGSVLTPVAQRVEDWSVGLVQSLTHHIVPVKGEFGVPRLSLVVAVVL